MALPPLSQSPWRWLVAALLVILSTLPKPGLAETRFEGNPERLAGNQWRLTWTTQPGQRYILERSINLTNWDPVTEIDASADTTSFTDTEVPANEPKVFWRARRLDGPDTTSPVVSILNARLISQNGDPSLELTVQATDNVAVVGVNYLEGTIQLGAASQGPIGTWKRIVPVDLQNPNPRQFQARAHDAAGNAGFSDIYTYIPSIQSPDLLPIGPDGSILGDSLVGQKPDGSLNPFTYLPDLNGGGSPNHAFRIDFPNGGEIITIGENSFLDSNLIRIGFGPDSPTQLLTSNGQPSLIEITPSNGTPLRIKRGAISFADLADLMGIDPATGIPLLIHRKSELLWKGGTLTRDGIRGGSFTLTSPAIGLPSILGGFEKETINLSANEPIGISVHGSMALGSNATLEITKARPLQLQILPNGEITLRGAAEAVFTNGARFHADVLLDDPVFSLALRAGNVEIPLMASLSDLLPSDPESCIPGGFDAAALDHAAKCLAAHDRAYRLFIANARGLRPDAPGDSTLLTVPTPADLTGAAAEAWATLAASELVSTVPLQPLQETITSLSEQARGGGSNPIESIEAVAILNQLFLTATTLNQQGLADQAQAAILAAKPAILRALENPNIFSSEALNTIIPILTNGEFDFDPELSAATDKLLRRAIQREASRIGVLPGVTSHTANPLLLSTNPYAAFEILRRLSNINTAANLGGLDALNLPLFQECYQQVFGHAYQTILADIDRNLTEKNPLATTLLFIELNRLLILEDSSPFDITASPSTALVEAKLAAANDLILQAIGLAPAGTSNIPATRDQVFTLARQFPAVLEIADRLPNGDTTVNDLASLIFQRLETLLPATTNPTALAAETDENNLFLTLQAGIAHATLKLRNPSFPSIFDWNGPPVGEVAARLAEIAITTGDTAFLGKTVQLLLGQAATLESAALAAPTNAAALRQLRKRQLVVAAETLAAIHPLTVIEWDIAEARRAADPESSSTDGFLPGNLKIDKLHGSIRHNRLTGKTEGKFGGKLRLPKLDSSLSIHSGSIDSDGRFDIAASGALRLPGTPDAPIVTLTVPSSQPLHFTIEPARAPRISGRAKLAFDNGTSLAVGLRFDDPIYTFQAEVGSLDTGLRDAILAVNSPQLGSLDATLPWADYYDAFSNWLEASNDENQSPDGPAKTDDFPDFSANPGFDSATLLDAWLSRCLAEARSGSDAFLSSSSAAFAENFAAWNAGLERMLSAFDEFFPPNAEQRTNDVLKRLGEIATIQKKMAELLQALANANLTGSAEFDLTFVTAALDQAALIHARAIQSITPDPDLIKRPDLVRKTATAGLDLAAARQLAGLDASAQLSQTLTFLRNGMEAFLASRGLNPNGTINGATLATLDSATIEETFREFFRFHGDLLRGGDLTGPPESHILALTQQLAQSALDEVSFDFGSGVIDDSGSDESLIALARRLHSAYIEINQNLTTPVTIPSSVSFSSFLLHKELIERSKSLAADAWPQRAALLTAAGQARDLRLAAGGAPLSDVDLSAEESRMLAAFASQGTGRLRPQEFDLLNALKPRRTQGQIATIYNNRILEAATHLFLVTSPPWNIENLPLAIELQREIRQIDLLAGPSFPFPAQRDPAFLLSRLNSRTAEVAAANNKGKPPATIAREALQAATPAPETVQIRALLGNNNTAIKDILEPTAAPTSHTPAFQTALKTEAAALLNVSRAVIADRATAPQSTAAPDVALPGDLRIERAFGGFYYDRSSGFLRGTFGGKLLFPDPRASFEITEATFNNLGNFSINATTTTPVTVMDNDRATLTATLAIAGSPLGLESVAGTGALTVPFGPDQPGTPGTRTYQGLFSYDSTTPGKPLTFTAAVDGVQNEFKLGDDFALFNANLALTFSTENPDITLQLGGKAGFFARPDAPASLGEEGKFWVVCDIDELELAITEEKLRASFNGGTLNLAQDLFESDLPGGDGFVKFDLAGTLGVDFPFATGIPSFFGNDDPAQPFRVAASDFLFSIPGIEDSLITVNSCELEFFQNQFPVLTELDASFRFPLPGINSADPSQRVPEFGLNVQNWAVNGFPPESATITLNNGLSLIDLEGLDIDLLGAGVGSFPPVSLTFLQVEQNDETFTRMELEGGMRVGIESGLITPKPGTTPTSPQNLTTTSGAMRATVAGSFGWTFAPGSRPTVALDEILIEGNFLLGGALEITGVNSPFASLRIRGFEDLFVRNNQNDPFEIDLTASVGFPDIGAFQLEDARFVWKDPNSGIPEFELGGAGAVLGDSLSTLLGEGMPIYVKEVALKFLDKDLPGPRRPLIGTPGHPGRFELDNLELIITAGAEFPPAPPVQLDGEIPELEELPPSGPRFGGEITNLSVSFQNGNILTPIFKLDGVQMGIENLDIPPLGGLKGQVALFNLDQLRADPPRPDLVTFVGELGGDFNAAKVSVLLAASPSQIHGAGISVESKAGIPLDGGALGGILWNGASGGIHFKNSFDDPLAFNSYIVRDEQTGKITGATEFPPPGDPELNSDLEDPLEEVELANDETSIYAKPEFPEETPQQFDPFDVLQDNWPPRAVNPLLEEFPANSGRFVFKGSRMSSAQANTFLNQIGILPGDTRTAEQIITAFLTAIIDDIRAEADAAVNDLIIASNQQDNAEIIAHYDAITQRLIDSFDDVARPILRGILQPVGLSGGPSVRQQMHALLLGGVPGFNVTFLGSGTFTHTALAPVMDLKGTISASTTGAALSRGELRIAGIPVAEASLGLSLTKEIPAPTPEDPDAKTSVISPFFGGLARVGIGPIQLGKVTMSAKFPDAAAIVTHFDAYLNCTTTALSAAAETRFRIITELVLDAQIPVGTSLQAFLLARTDAEKIAVATALFEYFAQDAEGTLAAEAVLLEGDFNTLLNCFAEFVASTLNSLTPELGFGGKIEPSIFDIPMTTSRMPLASARMRYGPVLRQPDPAHDETFISIRGNPADFTDPAAAPGVREFSAYMQFSPSAMLLAPITGTFVALNPTNAAFAGFTALDFAEFGFSFQQEEWTAEKVVIFLTNPAQHFENTTNEFFNTAVFAAGYKLSPFGMDLADAQLRLVFPNSELHPRRPGGINTARLNNPVSPLNGNGQRVLPTSDEIILAALTAGRIKDATFRGELGTLVDLFPVPPPEGSESPDSNIAKIQKLSRELRANDPALTALAGKSFAKDYFPYGGIIGGGQLALPRLLTQGLPESWGSLFAPDLDALQWLNAFGTFAEDLSATETIGQLAYYIPAPNPILFDAEIQAIEALPEEQQPAARAAIWNNMTIESLLTRLQMDPAALIGRSINTDLYEVNEIVLAGWAQADLLGIPLAEARMKYIGNDGPNNIRRLEAIAQTQPGSWFSDFFSADATFAIQLPSAQTTGEDPGLVTHSTSELFELIHKNLTQSIPDPDHPDDATKSFPSLNSLTGPALEARVAEIQQSLIGSLPRISAEVNAGITIPPALQQYVRVGADVAAKVGFFAYSPYFDPTFEPDNKLPKAIAKRQGGLGIEGDLQIGYFSPDGNPDNDIFINTSASLALSVPTAAGLLPGLSGNFEVSTGTLDVPLGEGTSTSLTNLTIDLNTDPQVGDNFFKVSGSTPAINLGDFMRIDPLSGPNIGGDFIVKRISESGPPSVDLALRPAKVTFPGLANNDLSLLIHGLGDVESDFTLSTSGDFGAQITLSGGITLNDPFNNLPFVTLNGPTVNGTLSRTNGIITATFDLPPGFTTDFHPLGESYTTTAQASMVLRSDGTFDINLQSQDALEIPDFFRIGPPPSGTSQLQLTRNAAGIAKLRIQAPQLTLFPGANGLKKATFALPDLIEIESTGRFYVNTGARTLDLFGAVQASGNLEFGYEPTPPNATYAFTKSHTARSFSSQIRGRAQSLPLTVTNTGTGRLPIALELSGTGAANYHLSHSSLSLAPGTNQTINITFIAKGNSNNATLTLRPLNGTAAQQTVTLSGSTTTPATSLAELVRSDTTLGFGQFAAGLREARSTLLTNTGDAPVNISSVTLPSGMTLQTSVTGTLAPGASRVVPIVYQPTAPGTTSGNLTFNTAVGSNSTPLSGTIVNSNFIRIFNGSRPFVSLSMADTFGTAVDTDGRTWQTTNEGVTWKPEIVPNLPITTTLQPKVLAATSGGSQFKWLIGSAGEYWQTTPTTPWTKSIKPEFSNPARNWKAIARHSNLGTPLALVAGTEGTTGLIIRETAPGSFAELTFPNTVIRSIVTNTNDQTAIAICDAGKLLRSTNGGASFTDLTIAPATTKLLAADISNTGGSSGARPAIIGASNGTIFRSTNSGASWSAASINTPGFVLGDIISVAISNTRGLAVDSQGILLTSSNGGASWTAAEQGFTRARIKSIARSGADFWALTDNGEIHYRIPDGIGLISPPVTLLNDQLDLGLIPTTTPGPHLRTTGITNVGSSSLNLTFTPSGGNVTVTPATMSLAPGETKGIRVGLTTTSTVGNVSGFVSITAAGFSKPHTLSISGKVQNRTWAVHNNSPTTSNLIDVETRDANIRHALSSTHFYQTLNRGTLWTERALPAAGNRAMFFTSTSTGVVVGGSTTTGRIHRTTDSGATWTTVLSENTSSLNAGRAVMDVHIRSNGIGYAITRGANNLLSQFRSGRLLRTIDNGATWTSINGPTSDPSFSGTSVHAVSDSLAFVAAGNTIWTYNFSNSTWTSVRTFGSPIKRVRFAADSANTGWIVGENSLFAITTTGGTTFGSWGPMMETFPDGGNFDDLCFDIAGHAKTILNLPDSMQVWQQGVTNGDFWVRDAFPFAVAATTPRGRAIDMASTGGQGTIVGDGGVIWMYDATPAVLPDRSLVTAPVLDFGVQRENANPLTLNLTVLNPGAATTRINDIIIENLGTEESFTAALGAVIIAPNNTVTIPVTFSGLAPGNHEAVITIISDNPIGIHTRTRLTATVQAEPAGLVVRSFPSGLPLTVGGSPTTATTSRVIRDGSPAVGELNVGQSLAIAAPPTQTDSGITYRFANWNGGAGGTGPSFSHLADNASRFTEAIYRPYFPVSSSLGGTTLYQESFSGPSSQPLHGRTPDITINNATWSSHPSNWRANGTTAIDDIFSYSSFLPFTPVPGNVYALSLDVNPGPNTSEDWFGVGFTATANTNNHLFNSSSSPWMAARGRRGNPGDVFGNLGVFGTSVTHPGTTGVMNLKIHLDTTGPLWTAEWFLNDNSLGSPVTFTTNPTINFVGFGQFIRALGTVDNFKLEVVPKPVAIPIAGDAPATRPTAGPWVRLTQAKLRVPSLREFAVDGEMYLSGENIHASLASTAFQVPQNSSAPVLEVGSGSWTLDWVKNGAFSFKSASPSLKIFNNDVLPSTTASLNFQSNGDFGMNFSLPEAFQDASGLIEIAPVGPTPASIGFSFNNNVASFNFNATIRALKNGQGGWFVNETVTVNEGAAIFPRNLTLSNINLGAFSITGGTLSLTRHPTTGVIGVAMSNVNLAGPLGTINGLNASVETDGTATFSHSGTVTMGPFQLVPVSGSTQITLNALTGRLAVNLPTCHLNAASGNPFADGRWPQNTITIPGFQFDSSGAFERRIPLPALTIDGIGINPGGDIDNNHVVFKRSRSGALSVFVRDRQEFVGNISHLEFEIRSDGILRGKYYGEMELLGHQLGMISMSYDSSDSEYQFEGSFRVPAIPNISISCGFGSAGGYVGGRP